MKDFPIYTDEQRLLYLSYWYERLGRFLLYQDYISLDRWFQKKQLSHFDIDDAHLRAFVEVKGCSNTNSLKLFPDQLQFQLNELECPNPDGYVWIFSYRNRNGSQGRKRLLKHSSGTSWNELSTFLAKNTTVAYLVDIRLLDRYREVRGVYEYKRDKFNPRYVIKINRNDLRNTAQNPREELFELGIPDEEMSRWLPPNANQFLSRKIQTKIDGHRVSFELVMLVPNSFKTRFLRRLNGTVQKHSLS